MSQAGRIGSVTFLLAGAVGALVAACGGGSSGGGGSGAPMYIATCSLGCSSGASSSTVSCSIAQHSRNGDVSVFFSQPINPATVTPATFQIIDVRNGQSPVGVRFVDSTNPSGTKMIFRPAVFFDQGGNTVFGLSPIETYRVTVPGQAHGDLGPFVVSTTNGVNQSRMQCDFTTTTDVDDLVAGPPRVSVLVQRAIPGDPTHGTDFVAANGLTDVWRDSQISLRFNDIMNPATLLNPNTNQPTLITVQVETNHNAATRVPLFGHVDLSIDLVHLRTQLQFTAANGMPSGVDSTAQPREIIVTVPQTVTDLVGNQTANPGEFRFQPERVFLPPATLPDANGENFTDTANRDAATSGADWGSGRLTLGYGGGSGRLGALLVPTLQTVKLTTDGTEVRNVSMPDFPSSYTVLRTTGLLDNSHPNANPAGPADYSPNPLSWPTIVVTDGVFEFSSLEVQTGATLRIEGTKSARVFSRGPVSIQGSIDVRGTTPTEHDSFDLQGGTGALGGPSGGQGGDGGDAYDHTGDDLFNNGLARSNPGAVLDGGRGRGLGGVGFRGGGFGGCAFPNPGPTCTCVDPLVCPLGGAAFSDPGPLPNGNEGDCTGRQVASPGAGGAYATSGGAAQPLPPVPDAQDPSGSGTISNMPDCIARGANWQTLGIEPPDPESGHRVRLLDAQQFLRGGTGGGGGGSQIYDTDLGGWPPSSICYGCDGFSTFAFITDYRDHSACGGGGGGGALQLVSGSSLVLDGSIAAQGGDGGSSLFDTLVIPGVYDGTRHSRALGGGGGSGGAVHLQAPTVDIFARDPNDPHDAPRIDVTGGLGGLTYANYFQTTSLIGQGGAGGAGLMRLEDLSGGTNPPATLMTRCSEAPKLAPFDASADPCGIASLSVGPWAVPSHRPETFSAASSCWMKAGGNYFELAFLADDNTASPPVFGWNMDIVYHDPVSGTDVLTTYRGRDANTPFPSGDFESNLGHDLNYLDAPTPPGNAFGTGPFDPSRSSGSYLAVRFQGAVANLTDVGNSPCDLVLSGPNSQIETGSLTPWVTHPNELNNFRPRPNIVRFCVVFDRSLAVGSGTINTLIKGVTNLKIEAQPN